MNVPTTTLNAKPHFLAVWEQTGLVFEDNASTIAELAQVELYVLEDLILRLPVMPQEAQSVLTILSQYTGLTYMLEALDIPLIELNIDIPFITQRGQESYGQAQIL